MAPRFRAANRSRNLLNGINDITLRPQIGAGQEAHTKKRTLSHLKQMLTLTQKLPKSSRYGPRKLRRGLVRMDSRQNYQRVIIKSRIVRHRGLQARSLEKHLSYLQRDGVGADGKAAKMFDFEHDHNELKPAKFANNWSNDRHHFRFIISPEKASDLDLKQYTRDLVREVEHDLESKLQWVSVTHHNTDKPHIHLIVRGRDDTGFDLVMSRDYLSRGMRTAAQEVATRELGFRHRLDIEIETQKGLNCARPTQLDYTLKQDAEQDITGLVNTQKVKGKETSRVITQRHYKLARLSFLQQLGLAREVDKGFWKIDDNLIPKLREHSIKGDIIKNINRRLQGKSQTAELLLFDRQTSAKEVLGQVIHKGLVNELYDQTYIIVKDQKGQNHHISLAEKTHFLGEECDIGDAVRVTVQAQNPLRKSDSIIEQQAAKNGGVYNLREHLQQVERQNYLPGPVTPADYIRNFQKRLAALERKGLVQQIDQNRWQVPDDLCKRLKASQQQNLLVENLGRDRTRER